MAKKKVSTYLNPETWDLFLAYAKTQRRSGAEQLDLVMSDVIKEYVKENGPLPVLNNDRDPNDDKKQA